MRELIERRRVEDGLDNAMGYNPGPDASVFMDPADDEEARMRRLCDIELEPADQMAYEAVSPHSSSSSLNSPPLILSPIGPILKQRVKGGGRLDMARSSARGASRGTDQNGVLDFSQTSGMAGCLSGPTPRAGPAGGVPHAGGEPQTTGNASPVPVLTPVPVPGPISCPRPAEGTFLFDVNGPAADAYKASNAKPAMDKLILDHFSMKNPGRSGS